MYPHGKQYVDPNYGGGGIGEYSYYDKNTDQYKCYAKGGCKTKMDCHLSDTDWKLLGVFKMESIHGKSGFMAQLFPHEAACLWDNDTYQLAAMMGKKMPYGCQALNQTLTNGGNLYYDAKPVANGKIMLGIYTDKMCSKEYAGSATYDVYKLVGFDESYWVTFNKALDVFKQCQPCVAYDLSSDDFECTDAAGVTNVNQVRFFYSICVLVSHNFALSITKKICLALTLIWFLLPTKCYRFSRKSSCQAASKYDIMSATRQQGLVSDVASSATDGGETVSARNASTTFPFSFPIFLILVAASAFCYCGLLACCKIRYYHQTSEKIKISSPLINVSSPPEPPSESNFAIALTEQIKIFCLRLRNINREGNAHPQKDNSVALLDTHTSTEPTLIADSVSNVAKSLMAKIEVIFPGLDNSLDCNGQTENGVELCVACNGQPSSEDGLHRAESATQYLTRSLSNIIAVEKMEDIDTTAVGREYTVPLASADAIKVTAPNNAFDCASLQNNSNLLPNSDQQSKTSDALLQRNGSQAISLSDGVKTSDALISAPPNTDAQSSTKSVKMAMVFKRILESFSSITSDADTVTLGRVDASAKVPAAAVEASPSNIRSDCAFARSKNSKSASYAHNTEDLLPIHERELTPSSDDMILIEAPTNDLILSTSHVEASHNKKTDCTSSLSINSKSSFYKKNTEIALLSGSDLDLLKPPTEALPTTAEVIECAPAKTALDGSSTPANKKQGTPSGDEVGVLLTPSSALRASDAQSTSSKSKKSADSVKKVGSKMFNKIRRLINFAQDDSDVVSDSSIRYVTVYSRADAPTPSRIMPPAGYRVASRYEYDRSTDTWLVVTRDSAK